MLFFPTPAEITIDSMIERLKTINFLAQGKNSAFLLDLVLHSKDTASSAPIALGCLVSPEGKKPVMYPWPGSAPLTGSFSIQDHVLSLVSCLHIPIHVYVLPGFTGERP